MWLTIAVVAATLLGPILAVQAQKWIERARDVTNRREYVFAVLMATRGARLDSEHIRALNMIDLVYYGPRRGRRNAKCQAVLNAWREYLDALGEDATDGRYEKREDRFVNLLAALAAERGVSFDRVTLEKGGYHPVAMGNAFAESNALRTAALAVLSGQQPIKVGVEPSLMDADA